MAYIKIVCYVFVFAVCLQCYVDANPLRRILERQKRVSDQRLAELETLIALSKMKGKLVTVPVGFGRVDPDKLGRRRRSVQKLLRTLADDMSLQQESEETSSLTEPEEERLDDRDLLLNLLFYEELQRKYKSLPSVRLPD